MIIIYIFVNVMPAAAAAAETPSLTSEAAVLFAAENGQVLYEKNMRKRMYPASVTKIMTGLLALERGSLSNVLTVSRDAVFSINYNSSHIALNEGEKITLEQALFALAVASANDAANVIAEYIAGNQESFGRLMTARAIELGAVDSNFVNAHGLPHENHYTTAYDMTLIMAEAIKNPLFVELFSQGRYEMQSTNLQPDIRYLNNSNPLLRGEHIYEGILASKNGWTQEAKHTLITAAKKNGRTIITVVMGNDSADGAVDDTINLLDYGFNEFRLIESSLAEELAAASNGKPEVNAEDGQKTIAFLLYRELDLQALNRSLSFFEDSGRKKLQLSLAVSENNGLMYHQIGKYTLVLSPPAVKAQEISVVVRILRFFLQVLLFLLLLIFILLVRKYLRRYFLHRRKRRRRKIIYRY